MTPLTGNQGRRAVLTKEDRIVTTTRRTPFR
jgi:hypothetical protein